jgi:NADPH:quinone reductase-like Zn-dependent oxidoreductase
MRETEGAAIVMRRYGGPEVLQIERVRLPALSSGEIRVRAIASAVNHADLGNPVRRQIALNVDSPP